LVYFCLSSVLLPGFSPRLVLHNHQDMSHEKAHVNRD
jgi:hypothetical protein